MPKGHLEKKAKTSYNEWNMDVADPPKKPSKAMSELVEDYKTLSISMLGRGLLRDDGKEKNGTVSIGKMWEWPKVRFEVLSKVDGSKMLRLWHMTSKNHLPMFQEVALEGSRATFGLRPYLVCPTCGSLRLKLQFTSLGRLACRSCLGLTYQCCRDNHSNPLFRLLRRYTKLRLRQTEVKRIDYSGKYTRKAKSIMRMSQKWLVRC